MPIKDREYYNRNAQRYGVYFVVNHKSGGFNVWKRGWTLRGLDVYSDEVLVKKYREQMSQLGYVKESLLGRIAVRAVTICGKISREVGRKVLGLPPSTKPKTPTKQDIKKAIIAYWHPQKTESGNYIVGEDVPEEKRTVTSLMRDDYRTYKHIARNLGGLKNYLERVFPNLYSQVSTRRVPLKDKGKQELADILSTRFNLGQSISPSILRHSHLEEERELYRRVLDAGERDLIRKRQGYTDIVNQLTGLPAQAIRLDTGLRTNLAHLTELFTNFVFSWSFLFGREVFGFNPLQDVSDSQKAREFQHRGHEHRADLRIDNFPIEVKSYLLPFEKQEKEDLLEKYNDGNSTWKNDNQALEKGTVIFHCEPWLCKEIIPGLKKEGLTVITYQEFHSVLEDTVQEIKRRNISSFNLSYLLELHEELSLHPFLICREAGRERLNWSRFMLRELIKQTRQGAEQCH